MVATVGVIAVLMAITVLGLSRRHVDLESAHQELTNVVRELRLRATVKGVHYRLEPQSSSFELRRLHDTDGDGLWDSDPAFSPKLVELPPGISIAVTKLSGGATALEFDTRGVAVDPLGAGAEVVRLTLTDANFATRTVEVWPSGQVQSAPIVAALP